MCLAITGKLIMLNLSFPEKRGSLMRQNSFRVKSSAEVRSPRTELKTFLDCTYYKDEISTSVSRADLLRGAYAVLM